jgi:hypothetical protein
MQQYLVKIYDAAGRFVGRAEFQAADDGDARRVAGRLHAGLSQELWSGSRQIASWPTSGAAGAAH